VTRLASDIREATKPIYCSACFNAQQVRHIDFDAACDRGYGNDESIKVVMDDLILCENCVKAGAELLGMTFENDKDILIDTLGRKLAVEEKRREKAERYADTLEDAISQKDIQIDHRKKPRQAREEVAA
jgi:hypothetical protein